MGGQAEPPMVNLGRTRKVSELAMPEALAQRLKALAAEERVGSILSTREHARKIVAERPEISGTVYLNASEVEIATPSFFDELLKAWPRAQLVGANPDVQESFDLVATRGGSGEGGE